MKKNLFNSFAIAFIYTAIIFQSCKKDKPIPPTTEPVTGSRTELSLDSIFLYAKQIYLWNNQLPDYNTFNPRQYATVAGTELDKLETALFRITQIPINSATGRPYEYTGFSYPKYSYVELKSTSTAVAAIAAVSKSANVSLDGIGQDFGFTLTAVINTNDDIRIRYVNPSSPAAIANLVRGYRVTKINGTVLSATLPPSFWKNAFEASTMTLSIQKPDGTTQDNISLTSTLYTTNPIFKKAVLTAGTKKVGYLAYARFSSQANSIAVLDQAFTDFANAGVTELVIDLRYNGGGYVNTAEQLTNLIAPSSLNGKVMVIEHYNDLMREGKATILANQILTDENGQPIRNAQGKIANYYDDIDYSEAANTTLFAKKGPLNGITRVYFIVSGGTASSSELVINSLRSNISVKLVGDENTYGKPTGFFAIILDKKYDVLMSNFSVRNSAGQGDYYAGLTPDFIVNDDVTRDFGDPNELCLSKALSEISGTAVAATTTMALKGNNRMNAADVKIQHLGTDNSFKGMIETRFKLKK